MLYKGGRQNVTKCHMGGGGVLKSVEKVGGGGFLKVWKKCHVLFEWPLGKKKQIFSFSEWQS
jgi:hypothetical protein